MTYVEWFNAFEAVWWVTVALLIACDRVHPAITGRPKQGLAIAFALFGLSDVIEIQTGAWWKPLPLLLLKLGCIATFIACVVAIVVKQRSVRRSSPPNHDHRSV